MSRYACRKDDALDLGEILEPSDAQGADRFFACVYDHMGGLVVVAVEGLPRFDAMFFHEANAADGIGMQHLLVRRLRPRSGADCGPG